jgi:DNA-3-methyladenine glycosylase II
MQEIATAFNSGRLDTKKLTAATHQERSQQLMEIWGVGQWTADMIGISYFNDHDVWPESDITVTKTLQRLIGYRRKTTLAADQFSPQRSFLARYMWKIADASPNNNQKP